MRLKGYLMAACLCTIAGSAFAATTYTNKTDFINAMGSFPQGTKNAVCYDYNAVGSDASRFGTMSDYANGLGSDGTTAMGMSIIATDAFAASSGANSIGVSVGDHQFLSGNSDSITFYFSFPVHAFGISLIGNPSPTGTPAIPFWKMHVNTNAGYDAYSTTDPERTISVGNDVYFLGVISSDEPFTQATVFSDNDPAAVFSFNIDDVIFGTNPKQVSIADVKFEKAGSIVMITQAPVERVHRLFFGNRTYIESQNRTSGIVVLGDLGANRCDTVTFAGTVTSTSDDEVAISAGQVIETGDNGDPVPSLGMGSLCLGGSVPKGFQIGIPGSIGPNNIGLDVTIWGKITAVHNDPYPCGSWIIVNDGAGRTSGEGDAKGVKVTGEINVSARSVGDFVVVRGSSSIWKSLTGDHYPLVRVADPADITPY